MVRGINLQIQTVDCISLTFIHIILKGFVQKPLCLHVFMQMGGLIYLYPLSLLRSSWHHSKISHSL